MIGRGVTPEGISNPKKTKGNDETQSDPFSQLHDHPEVMDSPFWEGSPPIRVSTILEQHATPAQKAAKIDLIDFLF